MFEFINAMSDAGITPPSHVIADGKLHRFCIGDEKQKNGWYVLHTDPLAGSFGNWKTGVKEKWSISREFTKEEKIEFMKKLEEDKLKRKQVEELKRKECRDKSKDVWKNSVKNHDHKYLKTKGIKPHGVRFHLDSVVVPVRDISGELHGLQFIRQDGTKRFMPGTSKKGCYFSIGKVSDSLCVCEGYATGASINECTGLPVAIAFDAGNLVHVSTNLREKFPKVKIIICADNDDVGIEKGLHAAVTNDCLMVTPEYEGMDFNDLHKEYGAESVAKILNLIKQPEV